MTSDKDLKMFIQEIEKSLSNFINVSQIKDSNSNNDSNIELLIILIQKINSIFSNYKKLCDESQF